MAARLESPSTKTMCGICGFVYSDRSRRAERSVLEEMNRQIFHRGPDDDGFHTDGPVGLAMRRLSIIDLNTGQQPVTNEDGNIWLVYNGEIYNYQELRPGLEAKGHRYRSHSDTETIVHLYEEYGRDCVSHLRGMFAFALWDAKKKVLFVARDRLGIKPLYYSKRPEAFIFGSEIKALLAFPNFRPQPNFSALPEYLAFGYLSGEETLFSEVRKLPPGHTLELFESGEVKIESYWDLPQPQIAHPQSRKYYVDTYRGLLEEAVSSHLMSDVPLGVFLSGGLDSSAVAALMTKIRREPIETFSVGYGEESYSELPYAKVMADHLKSVHHEVRISWQEFFDALPKLIWHEDEPIAWPSSVSLYFVAKLAKERVTVVLTGEGSDETLAGYTRYAWTMWNARMDRFYRGVAPAGLRHAVRNLINQTNMLPANMRRALSHTFLARDGSSWPSFYFDNFYSAFSESAQTEILEGYFQGERGAAYRNALRYWENSRGDIIHRLLYTDTKTYLVELLMKQDSMSMAASLESRVPFLDHVLVEFTTGIPAEYQTRGFAGKFILKSAVEDLLPRSIVYRKKLGFPTPLRGWLAGPQLDVVEKLVLDPRALSWGVFKPEGLKRLFAEHRSGQQDHYERIWRLLNLELWRRVFIERDPAYLPQVHSGH
ncbi:MAG TPA: asparagine synthase (glutamine-hydrolyzing) [Terriglobia bacterium]|nr:asparagine synthase (glutamine-hydrolyzing) [Terriglobia bacterium]